VGEVPDFGAFSDLGALVNDGGFVAVIVHGYWLLVIGYFFKVKVERIKVKGGAGFDLVLGLNSRVKEET